MYGGVVQKLEAGEEWHLGVADIIFTIPLWVPPTQEEGFHKLR